jgi:hypothetical protein
MVRIVSSPTRVSELGTNRLTGFRIQAVYVQSRDEGPPSQIPPWNLASKRSTGCDMYVRLTRHPDLSIALLFGG